MRRSSVTLKQSLTGVPQLCRESLVSSTANTSSSSICHKEDHCIRRREIFSESCPNKPKSDFIYHFAFDWEANRIVPI